MKRSSMAVACDDGGDGSAHKRSIRTGNSLIRNKNHIYNGDPTLNYLTIYWAICRSTYERGQSIAFRSPVC